MRQSIQLHRLASAVHTCSRDEGGLLVDKEHNLFGGGGIERKKEGEIIIECHERILCCGIEERRRRCELLDWC